MTDPLPDPFRLRVLKNLTAHLKGITPANGYRSDLADFEDTVEGETDTLTKARVYRGREGFGFNDPRPMLAILEDPAAIDRLFGTSTSVAAAGDWPLFITGFVEDDSENPTDPAHILSAEVEKRLIELKTQEYDILGLGGRKPCVTGVKIGRPVCRPADGEVSDVAFFFLPLTLTLSEDLENPFSST